MAEETVKNILVIGPSWVGDMVMSQALFMCLKKENPDSQITVMANFVWLEIPRCWLYVPVRNSVKQNNGHRSTMPR